MLAGQDLLHQHPLLQHAALAWLAAAEGGEHADSSGTGLGLGSGPSTAALLPLLRLATRARDAEVAAAAGRLAARRLGEEIGFEGNPAEAGLWLGLLPRGGRADCDKGMCAPFSSLPANPLCVHASFQHLCRAARALLRTFTAPFASGHECAVLQLLDTVQGKFRSVSLCARCKLQSRPACCQALLTCTQNRSFTLEHRTGARQ